MNGHLKDTFLKTIDILSCKQNQKNYKSIKVSKNIVHLLKKKIINSKTIKLQFATIKQYQLAQKIELCES